jgi:hypothetical protein
MSTTVSEKGKRGRKKKIPQELNVPLVDNSIETIAPPPPKKRGRKPKGGKIIPQNISMTHSSDYEPNIILHLKCSSKDICEQNDTNINFNYQTNNIQSFNFDTDNKTGDFVLTKEHEADDYQNDDETEEGTEHNNKAIWKKLNNLKINLHKNDISDKRSACFWCTYEFDNPPIFIPKCEFKDTYQVYGCFCSPQCGVAHLMNEKIDSSIKFERYQLLNHVYGKIYNYSKTIKPAPNPFYLLDKYYGNLTIKEYRDLFNNDQLLIVVDKPLSHVFPELYEDNTDFIINKKIISSNSSSFKLKRNTCTKKKSILDNLGIAKN